MVGSPANTRVPNRESLASGLQHRELNTQVAARSLVR